MNTLYGVLFNWTKKIYDKNTNMPYDIDNKFTLEGWEHPYYWKFPYCNIVKENIKD